MNRIAQRQRLGLLAFLTAMCVFFSLGSPYFLTITNLTNILVQSSVPIVLAVGMTLVIASAGIDLSVGAILALAGIVMAAAMKAGLGVPAGLALGLASGAVMGALNGACISLVGISPFIATLGAAGVYRAASLIVTEARPIYGLPLGFRAIGQDGLGPLPWSVLLALAAVGLMQVIAHWTRFGANARAVGDNAVAAYRLGVSRSGALIGVYTLSGTAAALASMVVTARLNTAEAIAGLGIELQAIAAVVMGGTSFAGGEARVFGSLLGALLIGVLANGLTLLNVASYYQQLVIGLVFMAAVLADRVRREAIPD
ncbi:MAG: ABC transporter permease [Pseudomonadota bacterium]